MLAIVEARGRAGISSWLDRNFIDGGDNYGPAIVDGIKKFRILALMCSATSKRSRNVRQEVMLAWVPQNPQIPAKVLSGGDLASLLRRIDELDADRWVVYATSFTISR